jgi:DNA-binding transcriptional LysR family regulator
MELYQLRTFATIAELGNLTQAAERLHISQSAASTQLKLLEVEFGVALFKRSQSGLEITPAGRSLLPFIQQLLRTAEEVVTEAKSLSGQVTGRITLALINVLDESLLRLKDMVQRIMARQPRLGIELHHLNSRYIIAGVRTGEFDAGIALGGGHIPEVRRVPLRKLYYRIVGASEGNYKRRASWKELESAAWISVPKGGTHYEMMKQLFKKMPRHRGKTVEANSEEIVTRLVKMGLGLGLMREDLALELEKTKEIVVFDKGRPSTYLQFVHRIGRENDPAIRAISEVLNELWPGSRGTSLR